MKLGGERLAVISDVHGNRWALEAVFNDIDRRGIEPIVNLGDSLYGPLQPSATADLLLSRNIPTVRGNEDRVIVETDPGAVVSPTLKFVRQSLTPAHLEWIRSLPTSRVAFEEFFLCHGSPDNDREYLLQEVSNEGVAPKPTDRIENLVAEVKQPVALCGHDHTPGTAVLPDGKLIVNPGSVGLQAYTDDVPNDHFMQTGSPDARYAIVWKSNDTWRTELVAVAYDWQAAAMCAKENGRDDWAEWLTTGCA